MQKWPEQYCKTLQPKTIDDVFSSNEPALSAITAKLGEMKTRATVVLFLDEVVNFFNTTQTMDDSQVAITVDLIIEEYPHFKTDDLKLCFKNAMKGRYGEVYNRIDGSIILGWLKKYNMERCSRADILSFREHNGYLLEQKTEGCFYDDYRRMLHEKAASGDKDARDALRRSDETMDMMKRKSLEKQRRELEEFDRKRHEDI